MNEMRKTQSLLIIIIVWFLFESCEKVAEYYLGIPLQPDFITEDFKPGLNIFGIIRPDSANGNNMSFVHVQKVIKATGDTTKDLEIKNAEIFIFPLVNNSTTDTISFILNKDTTGTYTRYGPVGIFSPLAGHTYELKCMAVGLPDLGGLTRIPLKPGIIGLSNSSGLVQFDILPDTNTFLYKVYLIHDTNILYNQTFLPAGQENVHVQINVSIPIGTDLFVYAYDENLANYIANSNVAFNINAFRQYDNQVTNGYGVFGSLNFIKTDLN